jgi:hypothetical protein
MPATTAIAVIANSTTKSLTLWGRSLSAITMYLAHQKDVRPRGFADA